MKCDRCRGYGTAVYCVNPYGHRNGCGCPLTTCRDCSGTGQKPPPPEDPAATAEDAYLWAFNACEDALAHPSHRRQDQEGESKA